MKYATCRLHWFPQVLFDGSGFLPAKSDETVAASGLWKPGCGRKVGQSWTCFTDFDAEVKDGSSSLPSILIPQLPDRGYDRNSGTSHIVREPINISCRASPRGGPVAQWGFTPARCKSAAISHDIKTVDSLSEQDWSSHHPVKLCLENPTDSATQEDGWTWKRLHGAFPSFWPKCVRHGAFPGHSGKTDWF